MKLAEEETKLLCMKSSKLEAQMNVYKVLAEKVCFITFCLVLSNNYFNLFKKEQEKRYFEFKTAESELILTHILE